MPMKKRVQNSETRAMKKRVHNSERRMMKKLLEMINSMTKTLSVLCHQSQSFEGRKNRVEKVEAIVSLSQEVQQRCVMDASEAHVTAIPLDVIAARNEQEGPAYFGEDHDVAKKSSKEFRRLSRSKGLKPERKVTRSRKFLQDNAKTWNKPIRARSDLLNTFGGAELCKNYDKKGQKEVRPRGILNVQRNGDESRADVFDQVKENNVKYEFAMSRDDEIRDMKNGSKVYDNEVSVMQNVQNVEETPLEMIPQTWSDQSCKPHGARNIQIENGHWTVDVRWAEIKKLDEEQCVQNTCDIIVRKNVNHMSHVVNSVLGAHVDPIRSREQIKMFDRGKSDLPHKNNNVGNVWTTDFLGKIQGRL